MIDIERKLREAEQRADRMATALNYAYAESPELIERAREFSYRVHRRMHPKTPTINFRNW